MNECMDQSVNQSIILNISSSFEIFKITNDLLSDFKIDFIRIETDEVISVIYFGSPIG